MMERREHALSDAKSALEMSNRIPYQALELANSALSAAKPEDEETHAYAFAALGSCYASLGRNEEASRHINEAQRLAFELRLTYVMARIHQARGWIAYSQGNSVMAFSDWQIAFDYFQQIRDIRGTAWILMHYAANYGKLGLIDHSIRCQISALDLVLALEDTATLIELWIRLAQSYLSKAWQRVLVGDIGFAIFDSQIATAILFRVLDDHFEAFSPRSVEKAFHALGEAFLIQNRPVDALPNLKVALSSSTHGGHYSSEARIMAAIGYAIYLSGDNASALDHIDEALQTAPDATPIEDLAIIHHWSSIVHEGAGDASAALKSLRICAELEQKAQQDRMERWAKVHDMTLGIGQALVSIEWIAEQENGWVFVDRQVQQHRARIDKVLRDDPLTSVLNRAEAVDQMSKKDPAYAVVFEILGMDRINEKFGRSVGDEVLRNAASVLIATMPEGSIIGRFSGSEFVVASESDAFESAKRALNAFPWLAIDPELNVRVDYRRVQPLRPHILAA